MLIMLQNLLMLSQHWFKQWLDATKPFPASMFIHHQWSDMASLLWHHDMEIFSMLLALYEGIFSLMYSWTYGWTNSGLLVICDAITVMWHHCNVRANELSGWWQAKPTTQNSHKSLQNSVSFNSSYLLVWTKGLVVLALYNRILESSAASFTFKCQMSQTRTM